MIPLEEARELILAACRPMETEYRALSASLGCVTAGPIVAREDVPPFFNSAMDGYAVRSADVAGAPTRLRVVDSVMAGDGRVVAVGAGEAVRIMTGAPLPDGADAVCMVERTRTQSGGQWVVIEDAVPAGTSVRRPGSDIATGTEVVSVGTELTPAHLGVIAHLGLESVPVHRPPTVGVLSTGDELREGSAPLPRGAIRDGNRPMLTALIKRAGYPTIDLGIVPDDKTALRNVFESAASECDAFVTSGGVSVGDLDIVRIVLSEMCGPSMHWMQVAIKPAKPLAFGLIDGRLPVFGLPGNPVSSMVSFELFARPALRRMGGHQEVVRPTLSAVTDVDLMRDPDGKVHLLRVLAAVDATGRLHIRPSGGQDSHQLRASAEANALAVVPDGPGARAGDSVDVLLLDGDRLPRRVPDPRGGVLRAAPRIP
jgi:molybdenum cofactor synthesis domain-containing protein